MLETVIEYSDGASKVAPSLREPLPMATQGTVKYYLRLGTNGRYGYYTEAELRKSNVTGPIEGEIGVRLMGGPPGQHYYGKPPALTPQVNRQSPPTHGSPPPGGSGSVRGIDSGHDQAVNTLLGELKKLNPATQRPQFLLAASRAIDAKKATWLREPDNPAAELEKLLTTSGLSEPQKDWLKRMIGVHSDSNIFKAIDPRTGEKNLERKQLARSYLEWLTQEKNKALLELLTNGDQWKQLSHVDALKAIEELRQAISKRDDPAAARVVFQYLILLTPQQRKEFAAKIKEKLQTPSQNGAANEHGIVTAFAMGLIESGELERDINMSEATQTAYRAQLQQRTDRSQRLYSATNDLIGLSGDGNSYEFNESARETFNQEVARFDRDGLIAFAAGLKGSSYQEYGEKLVLALCKREESACVLGYERRIDTESKVTAGEVKFTVAAGVAREQVSGFLSNTNVDLREYAMR